MGKNIEVSFVKGHVIHKNIFLRVPHKDKTEFIYIEENGEMWKQICDNTNLENPSSCDDGIYIDPHDLYMTLREYLEEQEK